MTRPRVTFGLIVLNGEPFTCYCLPSLYRFAHQIVMAQGAVIRAMGQARPDGQSRDGTLEVLYDFKANEDPDYKLTIVTRGGPWEGKDALFAAVARRQRAALPRLAMALGEVGNRVGLAALTAVLDRLPD